MAFQLRSMSTDALLAAIARANSCNLSGTINYNETGTVDGKGFVSASGIFVDNFLLYVIAPDYLVMQVGSVKRFTESAALNKSLWDLLKLSGLKHSRPKQLGLFRLKSPPKSFELDLMPFNNPTKADGIKDYYRQEYKISTCDETPDAVLHFLSKRHYQDRGFQIKDVDITQDFSGVFDKKSVIDHLLLDYDFRMQGSDFPQSFDSSKTILDNDKSVGANCLSFITHTPNGFSVRAKLYNKMVQMLESKSVRDLVGNHWFDWATQTNTRLANARNSTSDRGITRAEISIAGFTSETVPSLSLLEEILASVWQLIPNQLIFATPHAETWLAHCKCFVHSLIVVDSSSEKALLAYSYNEITEKLSGHYFRNWSKNKDWILGNLTLNGTLPIDIITINKMDPFETGDLRNYAAKSARLFKYKPHLYEMDTFSTIIVSSNAPFCCVPGWDSAQCRKSLQQAGFQAHPNCELCISTKRCNSNSKLSVNFDGQSKPLELKLPQRGRLILNRNSPRLRSGHYLRRIQQVQQESRREHDAVQHRICANKTECDQLQYFKDVARRRNHTSLMKLDHGTYSVIGLRKIQTPFGIQWLVLLENSRTGDLCNVDANEMMTTTLNNCLQDGSFDRFKILSSGYYGKKESNAVGSLNVLGVKRDSNGNRKRICHLEIYGAGAQEENSQSLLRIHSSEHPQPATVLNEHQNPYKSLPSLANLTNNSTCTIVETQWLQHYGKNKLAVLLNDNVWYQAGSHLEEMFEQINKPQRLSVIGFQRNESNKKKEAIFKLM